MVMNRSKMCLRYPPLPPDLPRRRIYLNYTQTCGYSPWWYQNWCEYNVFIFSSIFPRSNATWISGSQSVSSMAPISTANSMLSESASALGYQLVTQGSFKTADYRLWDSSTSLVQHNLTGFRTWLHNGIIYSPYLLLFINCCESNP